MRIQAAVVVPMVMGVTMFVIMPFCRCHRVVVVLMGGVRLAVIGIVVFVMFFNNGVNALAAVDDGYLLACGGKRFFHQRRRE